MLRGWWDEGFVKEKVEDILGSTLVNTGESRTIQRAKVCGTKGSRL